VLVVDDEDAIRELVTMVLTQGGYRCFEAGDGQEALQTFRQRKAEILGVITDVNMPEMDGLQLARHIRAIDADTKLIICSGSLGAAGKQVAMDLQVNGFIAKPWTAAHLLACVQTIFHSEEELVGVECEAGLP
jgi:CheY-like chemotaxis protein